jgi:hypothetical protein
MSYKTLGVNVVFLLVAGLFGYIGMVEGAEGGSGPKSSPTAQKPNVFDLKRHYTLEIDGVNVAGVRTIEGIEELLAQHNAADGRQIKQGGSNMVITKDWFNTLEWYNWRKAIIDGKTDRRTISIIF